MRWQHRTLIEKIIAKIAHEIYSERIQREENLFHGINQYHRGTIKTTTVHDRRLEGNIAIYINQRHAHSTDEDQQWVLLMLQNINRITDTRNSTTVQLTVCADMRKEADKVTSIMLGAEEIGKLLEEWNGSNGSEDTEASFRVIYIITEINDGARKASQADAPTIRFSEAVAALRHIEVEMTTNNMMEKRTY